MRPRYRPAVLAALVAVGISAAVSPASASAVAAPSATSIVWKAKFAALGKGAGPSSEAVSPGGSEVYVTGLAINGRGLAEFATVAYNTATGARNWVATLPAKIIGKPAVAVSPDGSKVFVTGFTLGKAHGWGRPTTLAYNAATGAELWEQQADMKDAASPAGLFVSPDGSTVYAIGWADGFPGRTVFVMAVDTATGARRWTGTYTFQKRVADFREYGFALSPDGAELVVTTSAGLVAFSTSMGAELWADAYKAAFGQVGDSVAVSADSSTVFTAGQIAHSPDSAYWTRAYNAATGVPIWSATYPGLGASTATSVGVSPNGSAVYVTGSTENPLRPSKSRIVTVAYDPATGAQLWRASYPKTNFGNTQFGTAYLAVTPDSSTVAVTSCQDVDVRNCGYVTLAYNASTGDHEMTAAYHASGTIPSIPTAIAVSPDSSTAFVTGWSGFASSTSSFPARFVTFAYRI